MSKIMDLADTYSVQKARYWVHHESVTHDDVLLARVVLKQAVKAEQDYARAVIGDRDEWKARTEFSFKERDKLTLAHAERTVERDVLRKLIMRLHSAKGRYHTQLAACDLFDAVGLKNERPTK